MKGNFENGIEQAASEQAKVENKQRSWEAPVVVELGVEGTEFGNIPFDFEEGIYGPVS